MSRSKYLDEVEKIREDARFERINILVWGPGKPPKGTPKNKRKGYEKRVQIRDVLDDLFDRGEVHFSEDKEMVKLTKFCHGQLDKEALQAAVSDIILILGISRGADLEIDHFIKEYPWFRDKVFVFLPKKYTKKKSLVGGEILDLLPAYRIKGYTDKEFDDCTVATKKAVQVADSAAVALRLGQFKTT